MPGKDGVVLNDGSRERRAQIRQVQDADLQRKMAAGTFGHAQLFPGMKIKDPRSFPRLPAPSGPRVTRLVAPTVLAQLESVEVGSLSLLQKEKETGTQPCVYKPVMSDADISACN